MRHGTGSQVRRWPGKALVYLVGTVAVATTACSRNAYVKPTPAPEAHVNPMPDAVAPGTLVSAQVHEPLSTSGSHPGDRFTVELLDPVLDGRGRAVLSRGTILQGEVKATGQSKLAGQSAGLQLQILGVQNPGTGLESVPMEVAESPVQLQSTLKRELLAALGGGAIGAGAGIAINHNESGVIVGSTLVGIGAGALLAYLVGTRDATLPSGSVLTLRVTKPMRLPQSVAAFSECPVLPAPVHAVAREHSRPAPDPAGP